MKRDSHFLWNTAWLLFNQPFNAYTTRLNEISRKSNDSIVCRQLQLKIKRCFWKSFRKKDWKTFLGMRSIGSALISNKERFWRIKNMLGGCECRKFRDESVLGWVQVKNQLTLARGFFLWRHKVVFIC